MSIGDPAERDPELRGQLALSFPRRIAPQPTAQRAPLARRADLRRGRNPGRIRQAPRSVTCFPGASCG